MASGVSEIGAGLCVRIGSRLHSKFLLLPTGTTIDISSGRVATIFAASTSIPEAGSSCCNQRDDNVAVLQANRQSGDLTLTNHYVPVGSPSCIVFLDLAKATQ
jgi:hypothetical protein